MDEARIIEIRKYFKLIDRKRIGEYIVEMRRQTALELFEMGITLHTVGKILGIDHSTAHHYKKPEAIQKKYVVDVVTKNRNEWMKDGLYPFTFQYTKNNMSYTDFLLTDDPSKKPARVKRRDKSALSVEIDKLIDSI